MEEIEEPQIIFKQNEYEFEEDWNYNEWSKEKFCENKNFKSIDLSSENLHTDDAETIISLTDEAETIKSFKLKNVDENDFKKAASKFLNLHKLYPIPEDPGLNPALWILYPDPPVYKSDGVEKLYDLAKVLNVVPIGILKKQLKSDKVNLRYYCAGSKIMQALFDVLLTNTTVKSLDLQENYLSIDSCYHLNRLLYQSTFLHTVNLTACKIGVNGAIKLDEGITSSSSLRDLNLSSCELGSKGLHYIVKAVTANTLLLKLNISHNNLDEDSSNSLIKLITQTQSLEYLNLSWNNFRMQVVSEAIFTSLIENATIEDIDLSWNSIGKTSFPYISQFISTNKYIKKLNLTANCFSNEDGIKIARALVSNRYLKELKLNQNRLGSEGVTEFIRILNTYEFINLSSLMILNFGHFWATKDVLPALEKINFLKPELKIKIGGIIGNYKIIGPNIKELFLKTANYEAMSCKKKKERRNFGLFVLSLEDSVITKAQFVGLLNESKIKISENLTKEIMNLFSVTKTTIDLFELKEAYRLYFPDVKLPKKRSIPNSIDNGKKSKRKKKKSKGKRKKLKGKRKKLKGKRKKKKAKKKNKKEST